MGRVRALGPRRAGSSCARDQAHARVFRLALAFPRAARRDDARARPLAPVLPRRLAQLVQTVEENEIFETEAARAAERAAEMGIMSSGGACGERAVPPEARGGAVGAVDDDAAAGGGGNTTAEKDDSLDGQLLVTDC